MNVCGRACVADLLGDLIVYRDLVPLDPHLPGLPQLRDWFRLPRGYVPRKTSPEYARVVVEILKAAQRRVEAPPLTRLVYIGDTRVNDGTAFSNLCRAGDWPGMAFICAEDDAPARLEVIEEGPGTLVFGNRWAGIEEFESLCGRRGIPIESGTAVVIDLDKTLLGARGRNDRVIDRARVEAMQATLAGVLGDGFSAAAFAADYAALNRPEYHPFTTDNQDYLAYICLVLGAGIIARDELTAAVRAGRMRGIADLLAYVDAHAADLPTAVRAVHERVSGAIARGDPTPFTEFRRAEFRATIARMGRMDDSASAEELLGEEIVITREIMAAAARWRDRGALLFGLSDKPDEASVPEEGCSDPPVHRAVTHVVGGQR